MRLGGPDGSMPAPNAPLQLSVTYTDRAGVAHNTLRMVELPTEIANDEEFYQSTGVEKAVALARYVDLLQGW